MQAKRSLIPQCIDDIFETYIKSTIKSKTLLSKLKEYKGLQLIKMPDLKYFIDSNESESGYVLLTQGGDGETIINPKMQQDEEEEQKKPVKIARGRTMATKKTVKSSKQDKQKEDEENEKEEEEEEQKKPVKIARGKTPATRKAVKSSKQDEEDEEDKQKEDEENEKEEEEEEQKKPVKIARGKTPATRKAVKSSKQDKEEEEKKPKIARGKTPVQKKILKSSKQKEQDEEEYSLIEDVQQIQEITIAELIISMQSRYQNVFQQQQLDDTIIRAIKFVNEYIMDYESNNKKKPNVETLKYYDNDSEIVNININKYHYAPYLVNITFGLMNQFESNQKNIQEIFIKNLLKLLIVICPNKDQTDQKEQLEQLYKDFQQEKPKKIGFVCNDSNRAKLQGQFVNSTKYIEDSDL